MASAGCPVVCIRAGAVGTQRFVVFLFVPHFGESKGAWYLYEDVPLQAEKMEQWSTLLALLFGLSQNFCTGVDWAGWRSAASKSSGSMR